MRCKHIKIGRGLINRKISWACLGCGQVFIPFLKPSIIKYFPQRHHNSTVWCDNTCSFCISCGRALDGTVRELFT